MPTSVLVSYATRYGSTREAAGAVAAALRDCGFTVDKQSAREVRSLAGYGAVVLGAPLFMFRWHKDALNFLARHRQALLGRSVAVFALGPTHAPYDEKEWLDSRAQLDQSLAKVAWLTPVAVEIFGGKYDLARLRFPLSLFAGQEPASDIQDLAAVRTWASSLAAKLAPALH